MPLSDLTIRSIRPCSEPVKKSDGGGLFILVQPNGSKLWRLAYRFDGKQKSLSGGPYPIVGLAAARQWRDDCKLKLREGTDPSESRQIEKRDAKISAANSFEAVARDWLNKMKPKWDARYAGIIERRLIKHIFPVIGKFPINEIDAPILLAAMRAVEQKGSIDLAHRFRSQCGQIFRYAIACGICRRDPSNDIAAALSAKPPVKHRARFSKSEIPQYFQRLAASNVEELTKLALEWTMLTMVRTTETRFMRWDELELSDKAAPIWRIPAARMKMKNEHIVPLPQQAIGLLKRLEQVNGGYECVFDHPSRSGVISENRMLFALYQLGYHGKATVHGFRGLASTVLNEACFSSDLIERQLAHVERDRVRAAYNAAEWLPQRRVMLQWWADFLDQQRDTAELIG